MALFDFLTMYIYILTPFINQVGGAKVLNIANLLLYIIYMYKKLEKLYIKNIKHDYFSLWNCGTINDFITFFF